MSSARPPDRQRRGAHARHGGSRNRTAVGDQPRAGGSGRGEDGYPESGRRGPRHAGLRLDDPGDREPGDRNDGYRDPGYAGPVRRGPGPGEPDYGDPGYSDRGYRDPGYGNRGHGKHGRRAPRSGDDGPGRPPGAGPRHGSLPHRAAPGQRAPGHPGPGQRDDRRDYGLPGRDHTAAVGRATKTRSGRRHGVAPTRDPRPDGRRAPAQVRPGPRRRRGLRTLIWMGAGLVVAVAAVAAVAILR